MAAYCRVSTTDAVLLKSLENQIGYYLHLGAQRPSWNMVGIYVDRGISGTSIGKRSGLKRLLRHCEEGRIDLIVTKSVSRFSRNTEDLLHMLKRLRKLQVTVIFEKEGIQTTQDDPEYILTLYAAMAQREAINIAKNVEWGFQKRFERGIPKFDPILGYAVNKTSAGIEISVVPQEAELVREIFKKFTQGTKLTEIARNLMDRKIPTKDGKSVWSASRLRYLLKNSRYLGYTLSRVDRDRLFNKLTGSTERRKDILIPDTHPAIIDKETFQIAQRLFESRRRSQSAGKKYPLSKRVICGRCGILYNKVYQRGDRRKWSCRSRFQYQALCPSRPLWESEIQHLIIQAALNRFGPLRRNIVKKLELLMKAVDNNVHVEIQRMAYYRRLQALKSNTRYSDVEKLKAFDSLEKEFLHFESLAKDLEEDRPYRIHAQKVLAQKESLPTSWEKVPLEIFRGFLREIIVFNAETALVFWCDHQITAVGVCPQSWPTHPIANETLPLSKKQGESRMIRSANHSQLTSVPPQIVLSPEHVLLGQDTPLKVAAYCRVSTCNPAQKDSLEIQIAYYANLILQNPRWEFAGIYADKGVSGTSTDNRLEFKKMMRDCQSNRINLIITKSVARFSRNTVDCLKTVRDLKNRKLPIGVWFEQENLNTLTEIGELTLALYSSLAQEESISLGENIRQSKLKKIKQGDYRYGGPRCYGYHISKEGTWTPVAKEVQVIKNIYEYFDKDKTISAITRKLMATGIPAPKGGAIWHPNIVKSILENPLYIGHCLYQKTFTKDTLTHKNVKNHGNLPKYLIENHHPAIIEENLWKSVQLKIKEMMQKRKPNKTYEKDQLPKVLYCSSCGSTVTRHAARSKFFYRRCSNAQKTNKARSCNAGSIRMENLEHGFMTLLMEMKQNTTWLENAKSDAFSPPLTESMITKKIALESELLICYHALHEQIKTQHQNVKIDKKDLTPWVQKVLKLKNELRYFDEIIEKSIERHRSYEWFVEELKNLPLYDPQACRLPFRADIFRRIVIRGLLDKNQVIHYQFRFGSALVAVCPVTKAWLLPILQLEEVKNTNICSP